MNAREILKMKVEEIKELIDDNNESEFDYLLITTSKIGNEEAIVLATNLNSNYMALLHANEAIKLIGYAQLCDGDKIHQKEK